MKDILNKNKDIIYTIFILTLFSCFLYGLFCLSKWICIIFIFLFIINRINKFSKLDDE